MNKNKLSVVSMYVLGFFEPLVLILFALYCLVLGHVFIAAVCLITAVYSAHEMKIMFVDPHTI